MFQLFAALLVATFFAISTMRMVLWIAAAVILVVLIMRRRTHKAKTTSAGR